MFCDFCGNQITLGTRFCDKCGRRVSSVSSQREGIELKEQIFEPNTYQSSIFETENSLYIFDMKDNIIYNEKNESIGKFGIRDASLNLIGEIYDEKEGLVIKISPILLSISKSYKIADVNGNIIAKIKKTPFSTSLMQFFIESPYKEKWFGIYRTKSFTYKVKSYVLNNQIVAEFGHLNNFKELILDSKNKNSRYNYLLKIIDSKVDRAILISTFLVNYLYFHNS
ncbi:MAG: zinc ribbon domain-containing protein [Candidatus Lokiarchaeota archaeon]|nr:zinc ribbon domain-containing protein [Candidatus Lokiarchaeota archaeon]